MHFAIAKVEKLSQMYRKLAELRLRTTSCSFAVADLSVNLRCPALINANKQHNIQPAKIESSIQVNNGLLS